MRGYTRLLMKVYLDMCALKRPFDDQSQDRIGIETQAVMRVLGAFSAGVVEICNSAALVFENRQNPNPQRRDKVATLLASFGAPASATHPIFERDEEVRMLGFHDMDALHIAFAENRAAGYFITTDEDILKRRERVKLAVKIVDPLEFLARLD